MKVLPLAAWPILLCRDPMKAVALITKGRGTVGTCPHFESTLLTKHYDSMLHFYQFDATSLFDNNVTIVITT